MTTKDNMQDSLFAFIKDRSVPAKEKIIELEEMISLCSAGITILSGKGITSIRHLMNCLDEQMQDKAEHIESVIPVYDTDNEDGINLYECTKCGNRWLSKTTIPCSACYPEG